MRNMHEPLRSRGRQRGQHDESEEQRIHELRAKGSLKKPIDHKPGDEFERKSDRGNQRGFGKNQGKESIDRTTDHGTRGV